jgi:protein TonB
LSGGRTSGGAAPAARARASAWQSAGADPIIEVIFAASKPKRSAQLLAGAVAALATHGAILVWAALAEPSLESWAADVAMRVHAALRHEQIVELGKPTPPPPPAPEAPPPIDPPKSPPSIRAARTRALPPAPAQAGAIVAREPDPSAPVDLTADSYVAGSANAYAGGVTASTGTNTKAVDPDDEPAAGSSAVRGPDRSRPVALEAAEWRCAWPREADAEQIDEQTAVIRVVVRPDGSVESAQVVQDPGLGFGAAAMRCALGTRFVPAEDRAGRRVRAKSPPIRVRFTR